jgi:predicted nuclease of predicted toxin-antitoxin system
MKIIVDMCLSPKWVEALNAAGFEARHWSSLGAGNAPDSTIFAFARRDGSVVLTADLDFGTLHDRSAIEVSISRRSPRPRIATG